METAINAIKELGTAGLDLFWLPVVIWTLIALAAVILFRIFERKISAGYHYHSRVALLWGLAAGVAGSALLYLFPLGSAGGAGVSAKFIVIQNPVAITASAPEVAVNWSDPALWAGFATALALFAAIIGLLKLFASLIQLNLFSMNLQQADTDLKASLSPSNHQLLNQSRTSLSFSDEVAVPCTFGWGRKRVVLPPELRKQPEKLNMAVRHELTHIANSDYLINATVQTVKACFFFHPMVHRLAAGIAEYREMHCDRHVLQDAAISQKNYAELLLELSPKTVFRTQQAAVNMAVHPSTLKKRIQAMMTSNRPIPSMKWSLSLMLAFTLLLGGLMACSDIEEGGITQAEVEKTQSDIENLTSDKQPLFLIGGKTLDESGVNMKEKSIISDEKSMLTRIKPKYIQSIDVLKGKKATDKYGEKGKNGVINITLTDQEKALNDLYTDAEVEARQKELQSPSGPNKEEIYVAVENTPEIIGGQKALYENLIYPKKCKEAEVQGRVILQFVVTKEGSVRDAKVVRGIGSGCDQAALNAVNALQFKPGKQDGKEVNVRFSLPILFKLDGAEKKNSNQTTSNNDAISQAKKSIRLDEKIIVAYLPLPEEDQALEIPSVSNSDIIKNQP